MQGDLGDGSEACRAAVRLGTPDGLHPHRDRDEL